MTVNSNCFLTAILVLFSGAGSACVAQDRSTFAWDELPSLPDELGVAGPFAGVHDDVLILAGGANFPTPVWDNDKVWRDRIHVLRKTGNQYTWQDAGVLAQPIAYGASVSTPDGVVCIGGNDSKHTFDSVFVLRWDSDAEKVVRKSYPTLPKACAYGAATLIDNVVYVAGGQSAASLDSAMTNFWSLDLAKRNQPDDFVWTELNPWPGPSRAFNLTIAQHNGYDDCVYVISGRRQAGPEQTNVQFLKDVWEYTPESRQWRQRAEVPRCVMAGAGIAWSQSHIFVLGGDDGSLFTTGADLKDDHPGFIKQSLAYHTITDTWVEAGPLPQNQVTTTAIRWGDSIILPSGEVRPRVRSPKLARATPIRSGDRFGTINYIVLFGYLLAMVGIGVYFARKNRSTNDFFRGGQSIPWWAAGCSIFATMLSSLTFTGIPSKSFAQDWVYSVGNFMIPVVAVIAVFIAMPFFRGIDAVSAYEYLEKRFSRSVRLFGSASFTLFHLFRMAVVMSLTGMAMAVATPLTPTQSVLLMGLLSIAYCTMGGIEAVIWTDTIQTVVLMGGAVLSLALLIARVDGGVSGFVSMAEDADKFSIANFHWDATSTHIAFWVIAVGAIGQNLSSYTADQAVVQRYMTTSTRGLAARSIWTNAVLTIPATLLFFGIGTALFAFYRSHPEKLDPTITTDQVFPLFIAREMPVGIAGLIVAGVFAAAQSTVSTSMNSTATTVVTDFMRPLRLCKSERGYLNAARLCTFTLGIIGTLIGLVFVNPEINSLFDTFIKVIGLFMGVLGGLFVLGALSRRTNANGALIGASTGVAVMFWLWNFTSINGYLYTASGITSCVIVGLLSSFAFDRPRHDLTGLTIYTLHQPLASSKSSLEGDASVER